MKRKSSDGENYLDRIPMHRENLAWSADSGKITLEIENKGVFNKIAQKLLRKPKISYVHLDDMGSFIWPLIDGKKTIADIGKAVEENFGENANPLYERLAKYFQILDSYNFICWSK